MVTFSLPSDYDAVEAGHGTPRSRPPLPFAKRTYAATPYAKRLGTPQASSVRKLLMTRDEVPSSSLNQSSITSARNIFRASTISDSPPASTFSPSLPQSTMKKTFAPGATPESNRVFCQSTAQVTPRGVAAHATDKDLFKMRISSPSLELTGEVLANKVPKEWNAKGSIYADQFLVHLCPPELDDEQRRQFFCILDLRRLKYAANEIFAKKSWKLNIMNFAKEFEKSRSIILLRYGLYEFQNVKPSKEVLKRWRREHGLPEPDDDATEAVDATPSKPAASKKRKADDNLCKDSAVADASANVGKRRATVRDEDEEPTSATPAAIKNKRKASVGEEHPIKMQKAAPSSAKSLFEKIANKHALVPSASPTKSIIKSSKEVFATKPAKNALARTASTCLKPPATGGVNGNIFGYLSDASSAKNSGVEADAESETDSDQEGSPEAGQSDGPSMAVSGADATSSQAGSSLFGIKPATGLGTGTSSVAATGESTPAWGLFERITKDQTGQPVRAEEAAEAVTAQKPLPASQTWNPSTTPIKFAPSAPASQTSSSFGKPTSAPSSSIFAPKSAASNIFGAASQDQIFVKGSKSAARAEEAHKTGGESDKENDSQSSKKVGSEPKEPAAQLNSGSSLFGIKQPAKETLKESEPTKSTTSLFGTIQKSEATSDLFGSVKTSGTDIKSSALFGTNPAEPEKKSDPDEPKVAPILGVPSTSSTINGINASTSLFGLKPAAAPAATSGNLLGAASSTPSQPLFGTASSSNASALVKTDSTAATTAPTTTSLFSFGSTSNTAAKPTATSQEAAKSLFGTPQSPPSSSTANIFAGSPMKQDEASPVKKPSTGGNAEVKPVTSLFSFGAPSTAPSATPPTNLFSSSLSASNTGDSSAPAFGAGSSSKVGSSGFGFNFSSGGSSGNSFNNPFASGNASGNSTQAPTSTSGAIFSFGASSAPSAGDSGTFQFGNASGNQTGQPSTPVFGASSSSGSTQAFNVTAPPAQPPQNMFSFGGAQPSSGFNLQPPVGGSSTAGTNSPFNHGEGSSLATTPAGGTPEPSDQATASTGAHGGNDDGEKHEQISLTEGAEKDEDILHEVRAKVLKFILVAEGSHGDDKKIKSKSPWATQGVGFLRLLKHKETNAVRLLLRAEPRGNVAMNRSLLPDLSYKADGKYVKMTTSNETGDGLETWMIQVKTKDVAKALSEALEKHKILNKK